MPSWDVKEILAELVKMDPSLEDAETDVQYDRCHQVANNLDDYRDYVLEEMVDAVTFEKKWFWRKKR